MFDYKELYIEPFDEHWAVLNRKICDNYFEAFEYIVKERGIPAEERDDYELQEMWCKSWVYTDDLGEKRQGWQFSDDRDDLGRNGSFLVWVMKV